MGDQSAEEIDERKEFAYRAVIVFSVVLSAVSILFAVGVVPMLQHFVSTTNRQLELDLRYCQDTADEVFTQSAIVVDETTESNRTVRHTNSTIMQQQRNNFFIRRIRQVYKLQTHRLVDACRCEAEPGAPGLPGRRGMKGPNGAPGAPGMPARLPCEPPIDMKKACPDPCPPGEQGQQGEQGAPGDRGALGVLGEMGKNGFNGKKGDTGAPGPMGIPGLDGETGDPGMDQVPTPFIPGPPGPVGEVGIGGPPGPPGMPGIDGPPGPPGNRGPSGQDGTPGYRGDPGLIGPMGDAGEDGHPGVCPTYCATDGGVFFIEPPDWFFNKDQNNAAQSNDEEATRDTIDTINST